MCLFFIYSVRIIFFTQITKFVHLFVILFLLVNFHESSDSDVQESVNCLPYFVHLPNLIEIEFGSSFNKYRWKHVQFILQ